MTSGDELRQIWNSQTTSQELKGGEEMLSMVIEKTRAFDRKIASRNTRECFAGLLVAGFFAWSAWEAPSPLERLGWMVVALSGVWYVYYLLRYGGGPKRLDPAASLTAYSGLLRESYDRQIRLLRSVKYWAILPPYVGILINDIGMRLRLANAGKDPWAGLYRIAVVTAIFVTVWILNEFYALPRLLRLRDDLAPSTEK